MSKEELIKVNGGYSLRLSATLINTIIRGFNTFYKFGQSLGSSIRRIRSRKMC